MAFRPERAIESPRASDLPPQPQSAVPVAPFVPAPAGNGNRVYEIRDPASKEKAANGANVSVTGVVVNAPTTIGGKAGVLSLILSMMSSAFVRSLTQGRGISIPARERRTA